MFHNLSGFDGPRDFVCLPEVPDFIAKRIIGMLLVSRFDHTLIKLVSRYGRYGNSPPQL